MSDRKEGLLGGLILISGALIGAATALLYKESRPKKAGLILEQIKENFRSEGEITGSWIDYDPIEYASYESKPLVYQGGISIQKPDGFSQYHFAADIYTGELLDFFPVLNKFN